MRLDSSFLADLRELVSEDNLSRLESLSLSELTIGGVVELTCLRSKVAAPVRIEFDRWSRLSPVLHRAFQTYETGMFPSTDDMWAARTLDFFPVRGRNWADDQHYHPFESRFCKAVKEAGFGIRAEALTGALREMADNVAQHSGLDSSCPAPGLIGYYVNDGHVAFSIGDSGRGVLASLIENPAWANLPNSVEALLAVINDHASRRPYGGHGEGFKQVFRSLTDLNGVVVLCSLEGRVTISQNPTGGRRATTGFTGTFPGFQLTVNCSLSGAATERYFSI